MSVEEQAATVLRAMGGTGVGRRGFLRGTSLAALATASPALLSACGTAGKKQTEASCVSTDISATDKRLFFSNWPEYIDVKKGHRPTLEAFEAQSGLAVTYTQDINDNNEFFAKVQNQLGDCQPTGRDIITLTDWMAAKMIDLGWIQKLDHANIPNVDANMKASLQNPAWDPNRDHSVPWQSGVTGIAYNAKYTGEVSSMEELLSRSDLKGKVSLLTEMRDTMGFLLKMVGADPTSFSADEWGEAIDRLKQSVQDGQIRRFTGNDYIRDLKKGNLIACEAWSGDVIAAQYDNPDIKWVVPTEGVAIWSDNMMVPNKADHKANAEALMNYYYDPEVAAQLAAWVNYICPVDGAQAAMEKIDPSLVDNPLIFPDEEFLAQTWAFMPLDEKTSTRYATDFSNAQNA